MQFSSRLIKVVIAGLVMACSSAVLHAARMSFTFDSKTGFPEQKVDEKSQLCQNAFSSFCSFGGGSAMVVTTDVLGLEVRNKTYPQYSASSVPKDGFYAGWSRAWQQVELRNAASEPLLLRFSVRAISVKYGFNRADMTAMPLPSLLRVREVASWLTNCTWEHSQVPVPDPEYEGNVRISYGAASSAGTSVECSAGHPYDELMYGAPFIGGAAGVALALDIERVDLSKIPSGVYEGTFSSVAPSQFIDLGPGTMPVTIDFNVTVAHTMKVEGLSPMATLQPPGGWGRWSSANPPPRVDVNLPFTLETNSGIKVYLDCAGSVIDGHCALTKTGVGIPSTVPVQAFLTSSYLTDPSGGGGEVRKMPLKTNVDDAVRMVPRAGGWSRASLDLLVDQSGVNEMMRYSGSHYQGTIGVVFEWSPAP